MKAAIVFAVFSLSVSECSGAVLNLIPNSDFDSDAGITAWAVITTGAVSWSPNDWMNLPNSGSMALETNETQALASANSACFLVTPSATFAFGGKTQSLTLGAKLQMSCRAYSDSQCASVVDGFNQFGLQTVSFPWASLQESSGTLPSNAHSVDCELNATVGTSNGPTTTQVDGLYFNSTTGAVPVRLQSFVVD